MEKKTNIFKVIIILLISLIAFQSITLAMSANKGDSYDKSSFSADQIKASEFGKKISAVEILGPLGSISLSPFFGITCLSGSSMLADKGVLKTNNSFLKGNEALSNPMVFTAFLALTVLTSLPKLTTVTKAVAELTDQVETYSGIISYLVIYAIANSQFAEQPEQLVFQAGIFSFSAQSLLMVACTINIIVINTVKYFFELLALISPIPMLDAIFEASNKAVAGFLAFVYAINPWLAFVLNVILFLICLSIFGWARRRVKYLRAILTDPAWAGMVRNLFGKKNYDPDRKIKAKLAEQIQNIELLLKVFPTKKIKALKFKKKQLLYLCLAEGKVYLARPRLFAEPTVKMLSVENFSANVESGLLSNSLEYKDTEGQTKYKLTFSKVYNNNIDEIITKFV